MKFGHVLAAGLLVAVVEMRDTNDSDYMFVPATVSIHAGDSVKWVNKGTVFHNATNGEWDTDFLRPGEEKTIKFDKAGKFDYYCLPHKQAGMTGTVEVK